MATSWMTLYPEYYVGERALLTKHYPQLRVDEQRLARGELMLAGELTVRVAGGAHRHPILVTYPADTPFDFPIVTPIAAIPKWNEHGGIDGLPLTAQWFSHRHQMPTGNLCLFQRETRQRPGGDVLSILNILKRAEQWFIGHHTGRWPQDTIDSELEQHFAYASDLLIDDAFYAPELAGRGRMFFVFDLQRLHESRRRSACPMILTALTEETDVVQTTDARANLGKVYPWIRDSVWTCDRLASESDLSEQDMAHLCHGYWWSLPEEPQPFHDGNGLLKTLEPIAEADDAVAAFCSALGTKELLIADTVNIGFKYPGRDGSPEWLVLFVQLGPKGPKGVPVLGADAEMGRIINSRICAFHSHRLSPQKLQLRNRGVISTNIAEKRIAFIGVGSLGSQVAELLGRAGLGAFRLCDHDRLVPGNVARHVGTVSDFGTPKVELMARRLIQINPYLKFGGDDLLFGSITSDLNALSAFLSGVDLVVCTTADESVEAVVNQAAVMADAPVLYGRSIRRGSMGRAFLVRPRIDACKTCLAGYLRDGRSGEATPDGWVDIPEDEEDVLFHECGRAVLATSAVDLSFTATLMARVALDYLNDKDLVPNHWVWTREPAGDLHVGLSAAMSTLVSTLPPREHCPACSEPDVAAIQIDPTLMAEMRKTVEDSQTAETGGLLIGYVIDQKAIVMRITGPGPNAERTATIFRRDVEFVQAELNRAAVELGDKGQYLGEWHSHLVRHPQPSALDIQSLFAISRAPNYLTRCPVSVIAGLNPATGHVDEISAWSFPVQGRMYPIGMECG